MLLRTVLAALLSVALAGFPGTVNRAGHETVRHEHAGDAGRRLDGASPSPPSPDYTCSPGHEGSTDWKVTGTNLGGWLVLEPWITPSLFYQFLSSDETWGKNAPDHTGMDTYSFCAALGPHEANKQLRRHWAAWVRDEDIESIAKSNASHVRIPVGDWMWESYGPYANCTEGALHELDRALDLCKKYKLKVLIDIHTAKGSQNGFDNSGQARLVRWTSLTTQADPNGVTTFEHWPVRAADWIGPYDTDTASYPKIETANIEHQLRVVEKIASQYKDHPAVWGIEPLNEPWQMIPLSTLKSFYWDAYRAVRKKAPRWIFVFHDSFRGYSAAWADFLTNCPNKAMDTHIYQAWNRPGALKTYHNNACNFRKNIREIEDTLDMPLIVGEWSLATDNCAMWLNGFNDNLPGYPKVSCTLWPCAAPYMGYDQPGCPPAKDQPLQGPYGTGVSGPQFGMCPVTVEWGDQVDTFMTALAMKYLNAFNSGHGWFFWSKRVHQAQRTFHPTIHAHVYIIACCTCTRTCTCCLHVACACACAWTCACALMCMQSTRPSRLTPFLVLRPHRLSNGARPAVVVQLRLLQGMVRRDHISASTLLLSSP